MTNVASFISRLQQSAPKSSLYHPFLIEGIALASRVDDLGRKQLLEACSNAVATLKYEQQTFPLLNSFFELVEVTVPHSIPKRSQQAFFKALTWPGCSYPLADAFAWAARGVFSSKGNQTNSICRFVNGILRHNPRLTPTLKKLLLLQPNLLDLVRTCLRKSLSLQMFVYHLRMWEQVNSPSHLILYGACIRALHSCSPTSAQAHKQRAPAPSLFPPLPQVADARSIADLLFVRFFVMLRPPCETQELTGEEISQFLDYFHTHALLTEHGKERGCYFSNPRDKWMTSLTPLDLLGLILARDNFPQIWPLLEQDVEKTLALFVKHPQDDRSLGLFFLRMAYLHRSIQLSTKTCEALIALARKNPSPSLLGVLSHHLSPPLFLDLCRDLKAPFSNPWDFADWIRSGLTPSTKKPEAIWGMFSLLNSVFSEKLAKLSSTEAANLHFATLLQMWNCCWIQSRVYPEYTHEFLGLVLNYVVALARKGIQFPEVPHYSTLLAMCIEHSCVAPTLIAFGQLARLDMLPPLRVHAGQTSLYERLLHCRHSLRCVERVEMIEALGHLIHKKHILTLQPASIQVLRNFLSASFTEAERARIQPALQILEEKRIFFSLPEPSTSPIREKV